MAGARSATLTFLFTDLEQSTRPRQVVLTSEEYETGAVLISGTRMLSDAAGPAIVPYVADEREMLTAFLDAMRLAVRQKLSGVDEADARSTPTASELSLFGLVRHLARTECRWFRVAFAGETVDDDTLFSADAEFAADAPETVESVLRHYDDECDRSRRITARAASLDDLAANRDLPAPISLRWVLLHMPEETARHAGHADVLRETLDGSTGD